MLYLKIMNYSKNKQIYIIGNINGLKTRLDDNQYRLFEYIKNNSKHKISFNEQNDFEKNVNKLDVNVILYIFACHPTWIDKFKNIKVYDVWDLCCICDYGCEGNTNNCEFKPIKHHINKHHYDYMIYRFDTYITRKQLQNYTRFRYGYYIDKNIFKDYQLEKKYDVLFYGNTNKQYYPFRNRLFKLLRDCDRFNVKIIPYSSRLRKQKKLPFGVELAKLINQSWLTITTKANQSVLLQKYYEIAMAKSVACGNYPDLDGENYMKENMILIDRKMTDSKIIDVISNALKNKEKLKEIINNCYNYFMKNYTYDQGVTDFDKIFNKIK